MFKLRKIFLIFIILFPFAITSVSASWTYYAGKVNEISIPLSPIILNPFNYIIYPNQYPSTEEGQNNKNMFDKIIGGAVTDNKGNFEVERTNDGVSLSDPKSALNKALESGNMDRNRPFIMGDDYIDSNKDGKINKQDMTLKDYLYGKELDPRFTCMIVRETFDNLVSQYYSVYTCTEDLSLLNPGETVQYVYKTRLRWEINILDLPTGDYQLTTSGNIRGSCPVVLEQKVNSRGKYGTSVKIFDYSNFKEIK